MVRNVLGQESLSEITVVTDEFKGFWMNPRTGSPIPVRLRSTWLGHEEVDSDKHSHDHASLIVEPLRGHEAEGEKARYDLGIAFSSGYNIRDVIVSMDDGKTWSKRSSGKTSASTHGSNGRIRGNPKKRGTYTLMVKATSSIGESQPFETLWNPSGFMRNKVEQIEVSVK